jgi:hypothetical protein
MAVEARKRMLQSGDCLCHGSREGSSRPEQLDPIGTGRKSPGGSQAFRSWLHRHGKCDGDLHQESLCNFTLQDIQWVEVCIVPARRVGNKVTFQRSMREIRERRT